MNYQIDPHTLERAEERGATRQEIIEVIYTIENETAVTITVYVFYGNWE